MKEKRGMKGSMHLLLGTAVGFTAASYLQAQPEMQCAVIIPCMVGALYPDIDLPASTIGKRFKLLSVPLSRVLRHRGFIHTPLNMALTSILLYFVMLKFAPAYAFVTAMSFTMGFGMHLLQDMCTTRGIMLLYPYKKFFALTHFDSKHWIHFFITILIYLIYFLLLVRFQCFRYF